MFKVGDRIIHTPSNRTGFVTKIAPRGVFCDVQVRLYEDMRLHVFISANLEINTKESDPCVTS